MNDEAPKEDSGDLARVLGPTQAYMDAWTQEQEVLDQPLRAAFERKTMADIQAMIARDEAAQAARDKPPSRLRRGLNWLAHEEFD